MVVLVSLPEERDRPQTVIDLQISDNKPLRDHCPVANSELNGEPLINLITDRSSILAIQDDPLFDRFAWNEKAEIPMDPKLRRLGAHLSTGQNSRYVKTERKSQNRGMWKKKDIHRCGDSKHFRNEP